MHGVNTGIVIQKAQAKLMVILKSITKESRIQLKIKELWNVRSRKQDRTSNLWRRTSRENVNQKHLWIVILRTRRIIMVRSLITTKSFLNKKHKFLKNY